MVKLILGRWFRLAFPTYLVLLFASTVFVYLGSGPIYISNSQQNLQNLVEEYWWTILFFISNLVPWNKDVGLYWLFYLANELQFFILILIPTLYFYGHK